MSGRILVTGATGGLGRVMVDELIAAKRDVRATGRNATIANELRKNGVEFFAADLVADDLAPLLRGTDTVFHLAALSSPWGRRSDFIAANEHATQRLILAARGAGVSNFIFASTPSIYTAAYDQIGLTEQSPLPKRFANAYAETKFRAEQIVLQHNSDQFHTVALRPRAILSPHDTTLLPRIESALARGRMPLPGNGDALIELTDARDVARAFLCAEAAPEYAFGRAYNVSGGAAMTLKNIVLAVQQHLGRAAKLIPLNRHLVLALASALEAGARALPHQPEPLLTRYSAMVLGWSQTFDLAAIRNALRWSPQFSTSDSFEWVMRSRTHA